MKLEFHNLQPFRFSSALHYLHHITEWNLFNEINSTAMLVIHTLPWSWVTLPHVQRTLQPPSHTSLPKKKCTNYRANWRKQASRDFEKTPFSIESQNVNLGTPHNTKASFYQLSIGGGWTRWRVRVRWRRFRRREADGRRRRRRRRPECPATMRVGRGCRRAWSHSETVLLERVSADNTEASMRLNCNPSHTHLWLNITIKVYIICQLNYIYMVVTCECNLIL